MTVVHAIDRIAELGIVGAGGAGFPTAVKLNTKVPLVIVNGAECEPLLHKDKELMQHYAAPMLRGLQVAMDLTGAGEGVIGVKNKYKEIIEQLGVLAPPGVRVFPLSDSYPAGDEFILVHDVTGKVIPPGGLPKDVGAVVANVETLINIGLDRPVTHKYLTVAGAVANPVTLRVPVGMSVGEVIAEAGGATVPDFEILLGGVMMARLGTARRTGDQNDGRYRRAPVESLAGGPLQGNVEADRADRAIGVRPVPLLYGDVPALPAGASDRAAPGHAGLGLHRTQGPHDCRYALLLRMQSVQPVRLP